tara:strand:+ start:200 stop:454 length:255 start_codon:yes stop_codon:yes gene_type:complete
MLFHKVQLSFRKAFFSSFKIATSTKSLSTSYMGMRYRESKKTLHLFILKVREAISPSDTNQTEGEVFVHKFVLVGREKGEIGKS